MFKTFGTRIKTRRRNALVGILKSGVSKESVSKLLNPLGGYHALVTYGREAVRSSLHSQQTVLRRANSACARSAFCLQMLAKALDGRRRNPGAQNSKTLICLATTN